MNIKRKIRADGSEMYSDEYNDHASLTVPNDALSIQQILINFTRGTLPPISKQPQYLDDETSLDNDSTLDNEIPDLTIKDDIAAILRDQASINHKSKEKGKEEITQPPVNEDDTSSGSEALAT